MSPMTSGEMTNKAVYSQDTEPLHPDDGDLWVDTSKAGRPTYVYDGDLVEWNRVAPEPSITRTDAAETFAESDVTVTTDAATEVSNGSIGFIPGTVDGTVADRPNDNAVTAGGDNYEHGIRISPNRDLEGVRVTVSANSKTSPIYLEDSNWTKIADGGSVGPGGTTELKAPLTSGSTYYVVYNNSEPGYYDAASYPYSSGDVDITGGFNGDNGAYGIGTGEHPFAFTQVTALYEPATGSATVEWPYPPDINAWDKATYLLTEDGETVTVDVEDGAGNVLAANIPRGHDLSTVDPTKNVRIAVTLERVNTANTPTLDAAYRRWSV